MAEDGEQEHRYKKYLESSWLINEAACEEALRRATDDVEFNKLDSHSKEFCAKQAKMIADVSGITLDSEVLCLYTVLRTDYVAKTEVEHHHSGLSDQKLFAEALRILGHKDALDKVMLAHQETVFRELSQ